MVWIWSIRRIIGFEMLETMVHVSSRMWCSLRMILGLIDFLRKSDWKLAVCKHIYHSKCLPLTQPHASTRNVLLINYGIAMRTLSYTAHISDTQLCYIGKTNVNNISTAHSSCISHVYYMFNAAWVMKMKLTNANTTQIKHSIFYDDFGTFFDWTKSFGIFRNL